MTCITNFQHQPSRNWNANEALAPVELERLVLEEAGDRRDHGREDNERRRRAHLRRRVVRRVLVICLLFDFADCSDGK